MTYPETRSGPGPDPDPPPPGADPAGASGPEQAEGPEQGWDRVEVITALRTASVRQRDAEIDQLALIAAAADVYSWVDNTAELAAALTGDTPPGVLHGERLWRFGADGTPEVAEFLTLEVGPALGLSPESAALLIGDVLDLRHRLPRTWKLTLAGRVRVWVARKIAQAAARAELDLEAAHDLDRHIGPFLPGWTPHQAFARVDMLIAQLDPERAEARRAEALKRRFVGIDPAEAGTARLTGQIDGLGGRALDATLDELAEVIAGGGHGGSHDERRALALEALADPTRAAQLLNGTLLQPGDDTEPNQPPATTIDGADDAAACDPESADEEPAESADKESAGRDFSHRDFSHRAAADRAAAVRNGRRQAGPFHTPWQPRVGVLKLDLRLTAADLCVGAGGHSRQLGEIVRSHLQALIAAADKVIIQPILDPSAPLATDTYEIPDRIRRAVTALYPTVVFPYSNRGSASAHVDLDHIIRWPDGPTDNHNLAPLDRRTHRAKTFAGYTLRTVRHQVMQWTTPTGQQYWVTPHGTYDYDPHTAPTRAAGLAELARDALRRRSSAAEQQARDRLAKQTLQPVLIPQPEPPLHWHGNNKPPAPPSRATTQSPPPF